jgi:hypothetical protein
MTSASLEINGTDYALNEDFQPLSGNYSASLRFLRSYLPDLELVMGMFAMTIKICR